MEKRDLLKGSSDYLLLSLLEQQTMYGYQIIRELNERSRGYFNFKEGTLYPALHRLEKSGFITGDWQVLLNGRQRRYYSLTPRGKTRLVNERARWQDFSRAVNLVLQL